MDTLAHTTLIQALRAVPDPRTARGKRHSWRLLLTVIRAARVRGCRTPHAIAQWVTLHAATLQALLVPPLQRLPSASSVVRALRSLDLCALAAQIAHSGQLIADAATTDTSYCPHGERVDGPAMDGKAVRGAGTHGQPTHLVSLVPHGSGTTLAQSAVEAKRHDMAAVPHL
jgi:hypothetical protein